MSNTILSPTTDSFDQLEPQQFKLVAPFVPMGDQPQAIEQLVTGLEQSGTKQVLLGVTGSGKTFTVSNVIERVQRPTLIIAHNKTLAAQLYQEFRDFFPSNAVSYFVSYYDYYQPEAYIPSTDTYIEKETQINDDIDKLRLATTTNLLTRQDVIVVATVSSIYNLGSPVEYARNVLRLIEGEVISRKTILIQLTNLQYQRTDTDLMRGTYRDRGETMQIWPAYLDYAYALEFDQSTIVAIRPIDPVSGLVMEERVGEFSYEGGQTRRLTIYPAKHYVAKEEDRAGAIAHIRQDLEMHLETLRGQGKIVEAYRLEHRVNHDLEMIEELGFVNGIENYSRYFDGRKPGDPPYTLLDHFAANAQDFGDGRFLTIIDESHITIPQIRGMYNGDRSRKQTLVEFGFRLPSALDNRPLRFEEFMSKMQDLIFVSATPADWELSLSEGKIAEQLIRPTGLVDPLIEIRSAQQQVPDLIKEILIRKKLGQRVLVTTLTKKMAEALTEYLNDLEKLKKLDATVTSESQPKVQYLHSDIDTLERSDILENLRRGVFDVIVGINLLREGLDLPEVSLVAILDADKEGFLRSRSSLIQTMGRAARHHEGRAILYADTITGSMKLAIEEVRRRRDIQLAYNQKHGITPQSIQKPIREKMVDRVMDQDHSFAYGSDHKPHTKKQLSIVLEKTPILLTNLDPNALLPAERKRAVRELLKLMKQYAKDMAYEQAAEVRDVLERFEGTA